MGDRYKEITTRNLIIFIAVVLASGCLGRGLDVLMGNSQQESLGMLLWLISPLVASLLLRAFAGDGWKDIGLRPLFKQNISRYIMALFVFPVVTILVLLIGSGLGWVTVSYSKLDLFFQAFMMGIFINFFKNIPEEFVWRGYLTPKVVSLHINDFFVYLIVGLVWGLWHVPYYLYFLDSETLQSVTMLSRVAFIPVSIVVMISWAIVFVELRLLTKSVWPALFMHMMEDAFVNPIFITGLVQIDRSKELFISPIYGLVSAVFYTIIGLGLRQMRKKSIQLSQNEIGVKTV